MAKVKRPVAMVKVTPIGRKRLDPYNSVFVNIGDTYLLDENKAEMLAAMGEVEIVEEAVEPAPTPVVETKNGQEVKEVKAKAV